MTRAHLLFLRLGAATPASLLLQAAWRRYASDAFPGHELSVLTAENQLRAIGPASISAMCVAACMRADLDALAPLLEPGGYAVISCVDPTMSVSSLSESLEHVGFHTVAAMARKAQSDLWALASKIALGSDTMRQLASAVLDAEAQMRACRMPGATRQDFLQLLESDKQDEVVERCNAALLWFPCDGNLWELYGVALLKASQPQDAAIALSQACTLISTSARAWENQALAWSAAACWKQAAICFSRSIALDPLRSSAHEAAAKNANKAGDHAAAEVHARAALALNPALSSAQFQLGNAQAGQGNWNEAANSFTAVILEAPAFAFARFNLGVVLFKQKQFGAAMLQFEEETRRMPNCAEAYGLLGMLALQQGQHAVAVQNLERALALNPDAPHLQQFLLFCMTHDHERAPEAVFDAHRRWGDKVSAAMPPCPLHDNDRDPQRRLRVGFVSADLRRHAVAYFIEPVWAALAAANLDILVYSNSPVEDDVSEALRALCHSWRQVHVLDDLTLAAEIRKDRVDILFDLSGHTEGNRLGLFALKPAPVQVTWIGYPNTTGLPSMDYALCDRFNAPPGRYEHLYVERLVRIPSSSTFAPPEGTPGPNPLPALDRQHVTFASFNRMNKLGALVIAAWSRILHAVPDSRMVLGNVSEPLLAEKLSDLFSRHGIERSRLTFLPAAPLHDYLKFHHQVDIILDTWPYTGGTTTNFALWMGVPVVTLAGPTRAHCQSAAILGRLGLENWVAHSIDQYVKLAVGAARAPNELALLRAGMRAIWSAAPLRQAHTVASGLELAVRSMWQRWCRGDKPEPLDIAFPEHANE